MGLLPTPMPGGAPAGPNTSPPAQSGGGIDDGEQANVTPEEQAQYDQFVKNGLEIIYPADQQGKASDTILQQLSGGEDPVGNLANTAAHLTIAVETSAERGGVQLDDAVVMHGGIALLEELAEVAEAAKIHDYSEDEMQGATYRALDIYREIGTQDGRVDPDQLKQQFGEIKQADEAGDIRKVLPQLPGNDNG